MKEQRRGQSAHDEAGAVYKVRSGGALDQLLTYPTKTYDRGTNIIREGEKVDEIHLVLTGLAARAKTIRSGERQFMALLVPRDLCDVEVFVLEGIDHDIRAMAETTCVRVRGRLREPSQAKQGRTERFRVPVEPVPAQDGGTAACLRRSGGEATSSMRRQQAFQAQAGERPVLGFSGEGLERLLVARRGPAPLGEEPVCSHLCSLR